MTSKPECAAHSATTTDSDRGDYPPSRGRLRDAWNRWKHKNFIVALVTWKQSAALSRAQIRQEFREKGVRGFLKSVLIMSVFLSILVGLGVLGAQAKGTLDEFDWQTRLALMPLLSSVLLLFFLCCDWFIPRQIRLTHLGVVRQAGNSFERWGWEEIVQAEIAQALFEGSQMRALQLSLRKPGRNGRHILIGLADKITDAELLCVFEAYNVPLTLTDEPPAGMERWQ